MEIIFLLLITIKLTSTTLTEHENAKEKVVNKGRMSRVTWQLHENEFDNLDPTMFDDDERGNKKIHYTKRKYNVKFEHRRKEKPMDAAVPTKKVTIERRKDIIRPKYKSDVLKNHSIKAKSNKEIIKETQKKNNTRKQVNIKVSEKNRKLKQMPIAKERNQVNNRNVIDDSESLQKEIKKEKMKGNAKKKTQPKPKASGTRQVGFDFKQVTSCGNCNSNSSKKAKLKKLTKTISTMRQKLPAASQVHKKSKKVYVKPKEKAEKTLMRREQAMDIISKNDEHSKSVQRKSIQTWTPPSIQENAKRERFGMSGALGHVPKYNDEKKVHPDDNYTIADELSRKVKVLCWVLTFPENHPKTCKPIKDTWGKRCNKLLFMSTEQDDDIPTVKLNVREGREYLWPKVKAAFQYVHDNYLNQYDWFVRADDDTYMVIENLRYMLADFDPRDPMYFGCRFKHFSPQGFSSGGAGIAISNGALKKLVSAIDTEICSIGVDWDLENDDVNLGICFHRLGVKAMDSRDVAHKGRFLVFMPQDHLSPNKIADKTFWYWKYVYYPTEIGAGCCSDYTISFHYVTPDDMYALEFLIYRIRPYGIEYGSAPLPDILGKDIIINRRSYDSTFGYGKEIASTQIIVTDHMEDDSQRKEVDNENIPIESKKQADNSNLEFLSSSSVQWNQHGDSTNPSKLTLLEKFTDKNLEYYRTTEITEATKKSGGFEDVEEGVSEEDYNTTKGPKKNGKYKTVVTRNETMKKRKSSIIQRTGRM